jgi:hypothetical protein
MRITVRLACCVLLVSCVTGPRPSVDDSVRVRIETPGSVEPGLPLRAPVDLPEPLRDRDPAGLSVRLAPPDSPADSVVGQIDRRGDGEGELVWVAPPGDRGSVWIATIAPASEGEPTGFAWEDTPGDHLDLQDGGRGVLRYVYAHDPSSPERLAGTYKPYHHVFDETGSRFLTKGPGGLYTHHRGIFVGWNRLTSSGEERDFWHMKGVVQRHRESLERTAGPVFARHRALVEWVDERGDVVVSEVREVTAYRQSPPALVLLDVRCALTAVGGDVFLNGDPEHAGLQYRAHNDVAEAPEEGKARYLLPAEGVDPHQDRDLAWAVMVHDLDGKRYSIEHMSHPGNPRGWLYSAYRDYGRFGAFFTHTIPRGRTLDVRYRIRVSSGDPATRDEIARRYRGFADPPPVRGRAEEDPR